MGEFIILPDDFQRIYAVGDVHGNLKELATLIDFISQERPITEHDLVVFIGDYIDRGPDSRGVIEYLRAFCQKNPNTQCLQGNHEEMLLSFLGLSGEHGEFYLANGGAQCLESYGIDPTMERSEIVRALPPGDIDFIQGLPVGVIVDNYILVHAGIRPEVPLEMQDPHDLRWIRHDFINNQHRFGKTVVFGHTSFNELFIDLPYKLGIDTGIAYGNALSIVELTQGLQYQVQCGESEVTRRKIPCFLPSGS